MAGVDAGFDAAAFRTAIRTAMTMGLPTDTSQQITFVFLETDTYAAEDTNHDPYGWSSSPITEVAERTVQVPAAVEWGIGTLSDTAAGQFDTSKVTVTLLDVDYALVAGCKEVRINNTRFEIDVWGPPLGLFDVTVYQAHLSAKG